MICKTSCFSPNIFATADHILSAAKNFRWKLQAFPLHPACLPVPVFLPVLRSGNVCSVRTVLPVPLLLHSKTTSYFPLSASFPISRCSIFNPYSRFFLTQTLVQFIGKCDGTMFPSGASDGNYQLILALGNIVWNQKCHHIFQLV